MPVGSAAQPLSPAVSDTSYDESNQILAFNGKNLVYDLNENLSSKTDTSGTTSYTWDVRNRLTAINGSSLTASFSYDARNRRISKTVNGTTTQYVYDAWDIIQEISAGAKTNYVRMLSVDEPLTRIDGATIRHYVRDALGSVVGLADDSGASKTTYVYDAFGTTTSIGESSANPFQFTGRENDDTGFYNYRYRYYSPEMQRFISEDLIKEPGGVNLFSYAQNNPINYTDPEGLSPGQPPQNPTMDPGPTSCYPSENNCGHYKEKILQIICKNTADTCTFNCVRACLRIRYLDGGGVTSTWLVKDHGDCFVKCSVACR